MKNLAVRILELRFWGVIEELTALGEMVVSAASLLKS